MADGDPIIITELSGDFPRRLVLAGPDRPERPLKIGGSLRLVSTWYPGAEEASVQVMGTEERSIDLRGVFNDVWTGFDGGALQKRSEIETLRLRQRRLRLTWGAELDVEGFLEEASFEIHRTSLIFYSLSFMVALGDQPEAIAVTPFPRASESDFVESLNESVFFINENTPAIVAILDSVSAVI